MLGGQAASWVALIELTPILGQNWLLVGGQMVFLHEVEREALNVRPTDDVDVVLDLRAEPGALRRIHDALRSAGFDQDRPSPEGTAHRYRRETALFDVLAPDNVGDRAQLRLGAGRTIEAPGTTQALRRSEVVQVDLGETSGLVRRPSLVGALLGKAAAVTKIASKTAADRSKHLRDFDSLSMMLGPSDRHGAELTKSERRALQALVDEPGLSKLAVEIGRASCRERV